MAEPNKPNEIARETLKLLAARRLTPTPDNYRRIYSEIAGPGFADEGQAWRKLLQNLTQSGLLNPALSKKMEKSLEASDFAALDAALAELPKGKKAKDKDAPKWGELVGELIRQWELKQSGLNTAKKKAALERVLINFGGEADALYPKLQALVKAWSESRVAPIGIPTDESADISANKASETADLPGVQQEASSFPAQGAASLEIRRQLQEIVAQTLLMGVVPRISLFADLTEEATRLAESARAANDEIAMTALSKNLKQFWIKLALRNESDVEVLEGLLRLIRLLTDNIGELVVDDQWLHGQLAVLQDIISHPMTPRTIYDAEQSFKAVLYKQGILKHSLDEAKATLKTMLTTFIDQLGAMSESTGGYHAKIEQYADAIGQTDDIYQINLILDNLLKDTKGMQLDILRSRDELVTARLQVEEAEKRIQQLESELDAASELVKQDHLTGALNRRGMDDVFEQELARAERTGQPLAVAVMDIDFFKRLNDAYGHEAGDTALVHLVQVVKDVIRPTDSIARFGGEEFVIILPNTDLDFASEVMVRVQRELTKRFFLHNNQRLLLTFSGGVALRKTGESAESVIARADKAMYRAKESGRNRVFAADE
ncbi:MAG: sensor domain-containing diguanylate cyclase [Burkholderiales bacterium]